MLTFEFIDPEQQIRSDDFLFVERFLRETGRAEIGWHYITDITWIYGKVKNWPRTYRVLDAGGGGGPLQFLLAELGFHVANIDMVLPEPDPVDVLRYRLTERRLARFAETKYAGHLRDLSAAGGQARLKGVYREIRRAFRGVKARLRAKARGRSVGTIEWIAGNLCDLRDIPTGTFDAVVSLSALEHIPIEQLGTALAEVSRVLKPEAPWAVTTSGTEQSVTWLHEPSQGWCYSVSDLNKRFGATGARDQDPASLLERYRGCAYLKEHLAGFYLRTERSGMPLGIWDPRYIPVGLSRG